MSSGDTIGEVFSGFRSLLVVKPRGRSDPLVTLVNGGLELSHRVLRLDGSVSCPSHSAGFDGSVRLRLHEQSQLRGNRPVFPDGSRRHVPRETRRVRTLLHIHHHPLRRVDGLPVRCVFHSTSGPGVGQTSGHSTVSVVTPRLHPSELHTPTHPRS